MWSVVILVLGDMSGVCSVVLAASPRLCFPACDLNAFRRNQDTSLLASPSIFFCWSSVWQAFLFLALSCLTCYKTTNKQIRDARELGRITKHFVAKVHILGKAFVGFFLAFPGVVL